MDLWLCIGVVVAILAIVFGPCLGGRVFAKSGPKEKIPNQKHQAQPLSPLVKPAAVAYVDLDILCQIESGGDCHARSPAGARGPYQLMRGAWCDAIDFMRAHPEDWQNAKSFIDAHGSPFEWDYDINVEDLIISRAVASVYINHVIPSYLTCWHLFGSDLTGPVPDTLETRLAAYNAGALRVRQAWVRGDEKGWFMELPRETRQFVLSYRAMAVEQPSP
jgi:hypothetical protein